MSANEMIEMMLSNGQVVAFSISQLEAMGLVTPTAAAAATNGGGGGCEVGMSIDQQLKQHMNPHMTGVSPLQSSYIVPQSAPQPPPPPLMTTIQAHGQTMVAAAAAAAAAASGQQASPFFTVPVPAAVPVPVAIPQILASNGLAHGAMNHAPQQLGNPVAILPKLPLNGISANILPPQPHSVSSSAQMINSLCANNTMTTALTAAATNGHKMRPIAMAPPKPCGPVNTSVAASSAPIAIPTFTKLNAGPQMTPSSTTTTTIVPTHADLNSMTLIPESKPVSLPPQSATTLINESKSVSLPSMAIDAGLEIENRSPSLVTSTMEPESTTLSMHG